MDTLIENYDLLLGRLEDVERRLSHESMESPDLQTLFDSISKAREGDAQSYAFAKMQGIKILERIKFAISTWAGGAISSEISIICLNDLDTARSILLDIIGEDNINYISIPRF